MREEAGCKPTIEECRKVLESLVRVDTCQPEGNEGKLADLVLTTGGAGCAPDDCVPEASLDVIERPIPGIPEAMRAHTMQLTKRAMLNRGVAGIRGEVLIVNLPDKARAVKEALRYLLPELTHVADMIQKKV